MHSTLIQTVNAHKHDPCTIPPHSKPRRDLLLRLPQRPIIPSTSTPHPINLLFGKAPSLNSRIIPQPRPLFHSLIVHNLIRFPIRPLIHRHNRRSPKAEIVLQRYLRPLNESVVRPSPQLPYQLRTLRDTARAQWMTFRYEPPRGINNTAPTIRDISLPNHLVCLTRLAESQRIKRNHLISRETIM